MTKMLSAAPRDKQGRKIAQYPIYRKLTSGEFFVGVVGKDNSLDSRYFGLITKSNIVAVVAPLVTFKEKP